MRDFSKENLTPDGDRRSAPTISPDLDADLLWQHLEESCRWERPVNPSGAGAALGYTGSELDSYGIAVTTHEADVYVPSKNEWRRLLFPVANVVPDGGSALSVLVGGHGDASLLELARLFHLHRNELSHGVRFAWWNGGGEIGFSSAAWYADHHFDLLQSRCLAYLNVDHLADCSQTGYQPYATAELVDWVKDAVKRLAGQEAEPTPLPRNADGSLLGVGRPSFSFLPVSQARGLGMMDRERLVERTGLYAEALYELCTSARAPIDLMAIADVFWGELEVLSQAVGDAFDLGHVKEGVKELVVVLEDREEIDAQLEPGEANRKMLDVCRLLNPILYTESGPYEHDTGGNRGVLPGLRRALGLSQLDPDGPERRLLGARLVRERNRVSDMMSRAILVARG
ncbi:MAG: M28 family peptidase [Nitrospinota bacterium]